MHFPTKKRQKFAFKKNRLHFLPMSLISLQIRIMNVKKLHKYTWSWGLNEPTPSSTP